MWSSFMSTRPPLWPAWTAIGAGATEGEATRLLQAYIAAMSFGKGQQAQNTTAQQREGQQT